MENVYAEWTEVLLLIFLMTGIASSLVVWSIRNGISPMPTSAKVKFCLYNLLPNHLNGTIYDLGSGWGTLVIPLAGRYPDCPVIGFETSPLPYWMSVLRLKFFKTCSHLSNVQFVKSDFFSANLEDASLIVCYLYPGAMKKLKSKFEAELKPGTWVISNTFAVPGWKEERVLGAADLYHTKIYLYKTPLKVKKS